MKFMNQVWLCITFLLICVSLDGQSKSPEVKKLSQQEKIHQWKAMTTIHITIKEEFAYVNNISIATKNEVQLMANQIFSDLQNHDRYKIIRIRNSNYTDFDVFSNQNGFPTFKGFEVFVEDKKTEKDLAYFFHDSGEGLEIRNVDRGFNGMDIILYLLESEESWENIDLKKELEVGQEKFFRYQKMLSEENAESAVLDDNKIGEKDKKLRVKRNVPFKIRPPKKIDPSKDVIFGRKVIYRDPAMTYAYTGSGEIIFNICINNRGDVSSVEVIEEKTTITDLESVKIAAKALSNYKYEADYKAPKEQCGIYTVAIIGFRG